MKFTDLEAGTFFTFEKDASIYLKIKGVGTPHNAVDISNGEVVSYDILEGIDQNVIPAPILSAELLKGIKNGRTLS